MAHKFRFYRRGTLPACAYGILAALACGDGERSEATDPSAAGTPNARREQPRAEGPQECALPGAMGAPECDACLVAGCCAEIERCSADPACATVLRCVSMCLTAPDPAVCFGACSGNGDPPAAFLPYFDCTITTCENECTNVAS